MGIENPVHLIFIGIVALLVLGPKRLPELARALGHGIREFREAVNTQGEPMQMPAAQAAVTQTPVAQPPLAAEPVTHTPVAPPIAEPTEAHTVTIDSTAEHDSEDAPPPG
ncbi:MAG TPA: twin-arginine translocase TatA/TatE family subunit [Solirubrobacteraceae bacterium]|nr:twin-arginine translocase TatA/TatE family subunit [Solirubrobacteraceae bacterium]